MLKKSIFLILITLLFSGCASGAFEGEVDVNVTNDNINTSSLPRVETPLNAFFAELVGSFTTLAEDVTLNNNQLNVSGGSWSVGDQLQMNSGTGRSYRGYVMAVSGSTLTLDTPFDYMFVTGAVIFEINTNLAVDGSSTTRIFQVGPVGADTDAYVSRLIFHCVDNSAGTDDKFCGDNALTNGLVFRYSDGFKFNIWNIKTNGDLIKLAYDITYSDKVGGSLNGVGSRLSYAGDDKHGTYLYLTNDTTLEIWVQDDLTGINEVTFTAQGYLKSPLTDN